MNTEKLRDAYAILAGIPQDKFGPSGFSQLDHNLNIRSDKELLLYRIRRVLGQPQDEALRGAREDS